MAWQNYTVQTVLDSSRALIDEYAVDGVKISAETGYMKTLEQNGIQYINSGLREIFKEVMNIETFEVDNSGSQGSNDIYTIYTMPDNFAGMIEIINLSEGEIPDYKWVGFNKLYVRNTFLGTLSVVYNVYPTVVTAQTDSIVVPNPVALEFLNNFVAARSAMKFNPAVADFYENKANELLFKIVPNQPAEEEPIEDVWGNNWGGYYGYY